MISVGYGLKESTNSTWNKNYFGKTMPTKVIVSIVLFDITIKSNCALLFISYLTFFFFVAAVFRNLPKVAVACNHNLSFITVMHKVQIACGPVQRLSIGF